MLEVLRAHAHRTNSNGSSNPRQQLLEAVANVEAVVDYDVVWC